MNCCTLNTISFVNATNSVVPFTGAAPSVDLLYRNEAGEYQSSGPFTAIVIEGGNVVIDHGGPATGIILIRSL